MLWSVTWCRFTNKFVWFIEFSIPVWEPHMLSSNVTLVLYNIMILNANVGHKRPYLPHIDFFEPSWECTGPSHIESCFAGAPTRWPRRGGAAPRDSIKRPSVQWNPPPILPCMAEEPSKLRHHQVSPPGKLLSLPASDVPIIPSKSSALAV